MAMAAPPGLADNDTTDNRTSLTDPDDEDDDPARLFSAVLASIQLDHLPTLCSTVRKQSSINDPSPSSTSPIEPFVVVVDPPLFGSYHVLFPVRFQDGLRWLLKVPGHGTRARFDASAAVALRSEALTMRLIRRETSIPIPDVLAFEASLDNALGCPFILMSFIPGISLYDCWFDRSVPTDQLHARRTQALKGIAAAMAQLDRFAFDRGGALVFDEKGDPTGVGPMRRVDHQAMLDRMATGDEDETALYFAAGPWPDFMSFYTLSLDRGVEPDEPFRRGLRRLLRLFLGWIPAADADGRGSFVLAHPDFDIQNVIVSSDGHLQGLIDWDGVAAVPRSVGNESYPSWLTRDWDPAMYGWNEDMERGVQPEGVWEDSPSTLAQHRAEYAGFMRSCLRKSSTLPSSTADIESSDRNPFVTRTTTSLFVENLLIAAENPPCTFEIMNKFFDEITRLVRDNQTDAPIGDASDQDASVGCLPTDFDVFSVSDALAEGELDRERLACLRKGFEALLTGHRA